MEPDAKLFQVQNNTIASIVQLYNKTEESLAEDVLNIKNWMKDQHHLPEILDDKSVQNFLILTKCNVQKAKENIDMYYTLRSQVPDLSANANPRCSNMKEVGKLMYHVPLPKLTKDMYRVVVEKYRTKDKVDQINPYDILKMGFNLHEVRLKEDIMYGDVIIFDLEGTSIRFLSKLTPVFLLTFITLYKKIYSLPVKGVYVINAVPYVSTLLAIVKTLIKPKLFERIHVCEDANILKEHFPLEMLPRDYGGTEKSIEELHEMCHLKYQEYQDRFDLLDKLRVNENLRPARLANENHEFLGYHGNFRKLGID
ncbi:hypothetical protein Zmor_013297 [Zophobas morio]|uniref:CRAL-TRIO domain-containing protein n=4 Tax=Zophobas morio TaxID=2755281 RepID=A0AA38MFG5_9CUCU|nr:hypothetical protein Zmor_013297 [Zophobas morio]